MSSLTKPLVVVSLLAASAAAYPAPGCTSTTTVTADAGPAYWVPTVTRTLYDATTTVAAPVDCGTCAVLETQTLIVDRWYPEGSPDYVFVTAALETVTAGYCAAPTPLTTTGEWVEGISTPTPVVASTSTVQEDEGDEGITTPTPVVDDDEGGEGITTPTPVVDDDEGGEGITTPTPVVDDDEGGEGITTPTPVVDDDEGGEGITTPTSPAEEEEEEEEDEGSATTTSVAEEEEEFEGLGPIAAARCTSTLTRGPRMTSGPTRTVWTTTVTSTSLVDCGGCDTLVVTTIRVGGPVVVYTTTTTAATPTTATAFKCSPTP